MKAFVVNNFGDHNSLEYSDIDIPKNKDGYIVATTRYIGINYADTHQTENSYLVKFLPPLIPGAEATFMYENERYVCATSSGSYSEMILVNKNNMYRIPDGISDQEALACMFQGITAYSMVYDICNVKKTDTVLITGASSGVGMFLIQMCKNIGANVVAVTSNENKKQFVLRNGADLALLDNELYSNKNLKPTIIFESYGGKYFYKNFNLLKNGGTICVYGSSSRELSSQINIAEILKSSKKVAGFWINEYINNRDYVQDKLSILFSWVKDKKINITIGEEMPFEKAKDMHIMMRNRNTYGKLILKNNFNEVSDSV